MEAAGSYVPATNPNIRLIRVPEGYTTPHSTDEAPPRVTRKKRPSPPRAEAGRKRARLEPGVTILPSIPRPPGAQASIGNRTTLTFARPPSDGAQVPGAAGAADSVDSFLARNDTNTIQTIRNFVRHLREEGNLVYLFAEDYASLTPQFKVDQVLNVNVNQIDPIEFAKAYPWVVASLTDADSASGVGFLSVPQPNAARAQVGAQVGVHAPAAAPARAITAVTHNDIYGIGSHLHDILDDFKTKYGGRVNATVGANVGRRGNQRITRYSPGDGTFSIYNTMLLKPEIMGLVRHALADINQWHNVYRKHNVFTFDDMLPNATIRSFFARYVAFTRSRSPDVGGNTFTSANQYGMPYQRVSGKTQFQLQDQFMTVRTAQRFFLSLKKRASGVVEIGAFEGEDKRLRALERAASSGGSRFTIAGGFVDAGGDVLASVLGGTF